MQLNNFKAVAKGRTEWQAIDLGIVMARSWYFKLVMLWVLTAIIPFVGFSFLFHDKPIFAGIIIWWMKPVWERPLLHVASRQLFGDDVHFFDVFKQYFKIIKYDFFWWITFRRFSVHRSFDMPVTLLEQLSGKTRGKRLNLLHRRFSNGATWLLICGAHIEFFFMVGIAAGVGMLMPQGVEVNWEMWVFEQPLILSHLNNVLWFAVAALIAPFYVCSGFALYLQRRIDLEGWDIEIRFRQMADRLKKYTLKSKLSELICVLFLTTFFISMSVDVSAEQHDIDAVEHQIESTEPNVLEGNDGFLKKKAKEEIKEVLATSDFKNISVQSGYRLINNNADETDEPLIPEWLIDLVAWLVEHGGFFESIGMFFIFLTKYIEVVLWCIVISIILYVAFYYRSILRRILFDFDVDTSSNIKTPELLFGLAVTKESLPDDVISSAKDLWHAGDHRQGLGLVLRASIVQCMERAVIFSDGNTERECAVLVKDTLGAPFTDVFHNIVMRWQSLAYAHQVCTDDEFQTICDSWLKVFYHE